MKYWSGSCAYSESIRQGCVGQDVFVDVGLTWRVTPQVSEGRASRTVRASVSSPWWEAIVGKLLREIVVINNMIVSHTVQAHLINEN